MDNLACYSAKNIDIICATCLCTNRRLSPLETWKITWFGFQFNENAKVCWECKRILRRMQTFREQVVQAQWFLNSCEKSQGAASCLSKLSVCHKNSYDQVYLHKGVVKDESAGIKQEPTDDDDSEVDTGAADISVIPVDLVLVTPGTSQDVTETGTETIARTEPKESSDAVKDENKDQTPSNYVIKHVSEEEMVQDRQRQLSSKSFLKAEYKCETCIIKFTKLKTYEKHKRTKHRKLNAHECSVCAQSFERAADAREHARAHHVYYCCALCAFRHQKLSVFEAHYETHHESHRVYACHLCTEKFLTRRKKKAHVQSAHGEAATCDLCNKTLCNPSSLKQHLRTQHEQLPRVECPICRRQYKGEHTLSQHMKTHSARAPTDAYCAECDITFKTRVAFHSHLRYSIRHASEDSFKHQCNECGRKFAMKYKLEDHIEREHLKILKYTCEQCGKKFLSSLQKRSHLNKSHHVNAAVVDKRATCNICGKEFYSASTCKKHQRVHTGERPYHCQLCPMQFSQGSTLRTHIRGKHKEEARLLTT